MSSKKRKQNSPTINGENEAIKLVPIRTEIQDDAPKSLSRIQPNNALKFLKIFALLGVFMIIGSLFYPESDEAKSHSRSNHMVDFNSKLMLSPLRKPNILTIYNSTDNGTKIIVNTSTLFGTIRGQENISTVFGIKFGENKIWSMINIDKKWWKYANIRDGSDNLDLSSVNDSPFNGQRYRDESYFNPLPFSTKMTKICEVGFIVDNFLYNRLLQNMGNNRIGVLTYLSSIIETMILAANMVLRSTDFRIDYILQLRLQSTAIHETCIPKNYLCNQMHYTEYITNIAKGNYSESCLMMVLTFRHYSQIDLEDGKPVYINGLAHKQGDISQSHGICSTMGLFSNNVAFISLTNNIEESQQGPRDIPLEMSIHRFIHEVLHLMGAEHDEKFFDRSECLPGGQDNFIMGSANNLGPAETIDTLQLFHPNAFKLSPCSIDSVSHFLRELVKLETKSLHEYFAHNSQRNCLNEGAKESYCGDHNKDAENGEQCDCGFTSLECNLPWSDYCCTPLTNDNGQYQSNACKLRKTSQCSKNDLCCGLNCKFTVGNKCSEGTQCLLPSICNGLSSECPEPQHVRGNIICQEEKYKQEGLCKNGVCLDVCEFLGANKCRQPRNGCDIYCRPKDKEECVHVSTFAFIKQLPIHLFKQIQKSSHSQRCFVDIEKGVQGVCDAVGVCRPRLH